MRHSVATKFIAILLAACALTAALGSALGAIFLAQADLYAQDYETWEQNIYETRSETLATCMAESYAARELGDCTGEQLKFINWGNSPQTISDLWNIDPENWCYQITDTQGNVLETNYETDFEAAHTFTHSLKVSYPVQSSNIEDWAAKYDYYYDDGEPRGYLYLRYEESPEFTVTVWMAQNSLKEFSSIELDVIRALAGVRYYLIAGVAAGLLVAAVCIVYLCCAAGKNRSADAPQPRGLNRLPLDIYAAGAGLVGVLLFWLAVQSAESMVNYYYDGDFNIGWLMLAVLTMLGAAVCIVGFIFALAAQWKMRNFYIWHHSVIGWCGGKLWKLLCLGWKGLCKLAGMLPLVWKYLLIAAAMGIVPLFFFYLAAVGYAFWLVFVFLTLLVDVCIVLYGGYAYGTVLKGAQRMADGELYTKIDTRYLIGSYKACAENLNALADVAVVAAKNQMKSDRMKTELITNVSHDIKTPLTSIINYIDLLQKAETPEQTGQYLEVLDRQSQRLKKLIEDLMEMSKATTGNLTVDITQVDAVEAVNQALGEFSDKLAAQELQVIFRQPESALPIRADGRLTWRVLSNLLSNVVKYALPGTRVYVDMQRLEGRVLISLKNISREELNVSAEELTERFVRGDASRNTEGSGLGLNIAKSLMELQKGQLQLLVDGDLFKVTLMFPIEN